MRDDILLHALSKTLKDLSEERTSRESTLTKFRSDLERAQTYLEKARQQIVLVEQEPADDLRKRLQKVTDAQTHSVQHGQRLTEDDAHKRRELNDAKKTRIAVMQAADMTLLDQWHEIANQIQRLSSTIAKTFPHA